MQSADSLHPVNACGGYGTTDNYLVKGHLTQATVKNGLFECKLVDGRTT